MKQLFTRILMIGLATILLYACKDKPTKEVPKITIEDSLGIQYTDSEYVIDNEYTKIKNQLCDKIEFSDVQFTNANTAIYSLDVMDSTRKFLFVSEVECGYTTGNCGTGIEIIERKSGKYVSILKVCGKLDTIAADRSYFEYSTFTKRKFNVSLNQTKPQVSLLSVHEMPYTDLKAISKSTEIYEDNLILKGEPSENMDAVAIDFKQEAINEGYKINVYNMDNFGAPFGFVFLHSVKGNSKAQQIGGSGRLKVAQRNNEIVVELSNGNASQKWKFNAQKKIFLPI